MIGPVWALNPDLPITSQAAHTAMLPTVPPKQADFLHETHSNICGADDLVSCAPSMASYPFCLAPNVW